MINGIVDNHLWSHQVLFKPYPLSNIERVEVLYGPAGAVYGPNAFLGIINVITKDAKNYENGEEYLDVILASGSYNTQSVDLTAAGHFDEFSYNFSARYYASDEPGIDDYAPWGFLSNDLLSSRDIWGPIVYDTALDANCEADGCPHQSQGISYGSYNEPSRDWGILADAAYRNFKAGVVLWQTNEGYGVFYPNDRSQPGAFYSRSSNQYYVKHDKQVRKNLNVKTLGLYRESQTWGNWAEAFPGSTALSGPDTKSWVSISNWNSISNSWLFKQDYDLQYNDHLQIGGGIKFESKELTKAWDVCGYYGGSFCSSATDDDAGKGIALNSDETINILPGPLATMPPENLANTIDKGIYIQGIWRRGNWHTNLGIRYDENSLYGSSVNPRATMVYFPSDKITLKLLYGEAFQEPNPIQLWGGWNGRRANPDMLPEEATNIEAIIMYQQDNWLHDVSVFTADYKNVIKEEAENAGYRDTFGVEYRGRFQFANFIQGASDISGYLYYTHTKTKSSVYYDHDIGQWVGEGIESCEQIAADNALSYDTCSDMDVELGDIAPHKISTGINLPVSSDWNLNLRANWVASKKLYLRNPLRNDGRKNDSYLVFDFNMSYEFRAFTLVFKVKNLFDEQYYHSGLQQAESGDDFSQRSKGWRNSLLPQTGRNFMLSVSISL